MTPDSGDCPRTRGEGLLGGPGSNAVRAGCFVNAAGNSNYRIAYLGSLVYVGVLGTGAELPALADWLWRGRDPGTVPGIWVAPG